MKPYTKIPKTLSDVVRMLESRIAIHREWEKWSAENLKAAKRYGNGTAKHHLRCIQQYQAAIDIVLLYR